MKKRIQYGRNMDYNKPTLIIISGPNGAGKSTHIQSLLPTELCHLRAFNRDLRYQAYKDELKRQNDYPQNTENQAVAMMEEELKQKMAEAIGNKAHFVLETPLSAAKYWAYIDPFESAGYQIQLLYLCLDSVTDCFSRVYQRTQEGGMAVDDHTIKGIYEMNLKYINDYRGTFHCISLLDGMRIPKLLVRLEENKIVYANPTALDKNWIRMGFPHIAAKVIEYQRLNKVTAEEFKVKRNKRI